MADEALEYRAPSASRDFLQERAQHYTQRELQGALCNTELERLHMNMSGFHQCILTADFVIHHCRIADWFNRDLAYLGKLAAN